MNIFEDRQKLIEHKLENKKCAFIPNKERNKNLFKCDINDCKEIFYEIGKLNKHKQRVHLRPFVCSYNKCKKTFGTKQRLLIHERIHENNKCEICKFCKKGFVDPTTLRNHIFNIHQNKPMLNPFICRFCHKQFKKRAKLKIHLNVHLNKEKRHLIQCKFCDKKFATKSNCNRHIKKHHQC